MVNECMIYCRGRNSISPWLEGIAVPDLCVGTSGTYACQLFYGYIEMFHTQVQERSLLTHCLELLLEHFEKQVAIFDLYKFSMYSVHT